MHACVNGSNVGESRCIRVDGEHDVYNTKAAWEGGVKQENLNSICTCPFENVK